MGQQLVTGYAPADGTKIYWESRGSGGTPLVLVHGRYGLTSTFDALGGQLAADRQVIAIELRGHGHSRCTSSGLRSRPIPHRFRS